MRLSKNSVLERLRKSRMPKRRRATCSSELSGKRAFMGAQRRNDYLAHIQKDIRAEVFAVVHATPTRAYGRPCRATKPKLRLIRPAELILTWYFAGLAGVRPPGFKSVAKAAKDAPTCPANGTISVDQRQQFMCRW
jgi:hypothetical protein